MFGYFSQNVDRCPDLRLNPHYVYDITFLEWGKRQVLNSEGRVHLCKNKTDESYEVICKRDLCYILVLFTGQRASAAERMFDIYKRKINELDPSVPWLHKANTVQIYKQINRAIQVNSNWTATHIAAKIGLDAYFDGNERLYEDMDKQAMPDMMTALHLAIQNGNLSIVRALAEHDASLDLVDISGFNSLHFASISTPEILMFVLSLPGMFERAKVKTKKGCTPLHLACFARKLENVTIFLRYGFTVSMLTLGPPLEQQAGNTANAAAPKLSRKADPIVKLADSDIDHFEQDFILYGGTPIHWTKKQSDLERYIQLGFGVDTLNVKGQTALVLKTQRMRFKCLLYLLCCEADVTIADMYGNTALHYAVVQGDITITQTLVIFDSDIDAVNLNNASVRHVISTLPGETINQKMLLYVLSSLGAKRCAPNREGCNDGCSSKGRFDGKRFIRWPVFTPSKFCKNRQLKEVIRRQKSKLKSQPPEANAINLVSFDGGGIKGLITIQMIHELQKRLKRPFIDYFEWMSGTSTGSIIAIELTLGRSTSHIRSLYFRFKDQIMTGSRPYSSEKIDKLIAEEMGSEITMADLYQRFGKFIIIPATLVDRLPVQLHIFRSFPSHDVILGPRCDVKSNPFEPMADPKDQLVWKAIRSSAAAPTYFTTFNRCIDGGILANNPTSDMLVEFNNFNYAMRKRKRLGDVRQANAVVSLGTGQVQPRPFTLPELNKFISWNVVTNAQYVKEMFNIIVDSACNTDYHVVERNESWCASNQVPMFRLNPDLIEVMQLNEVEDGEIINSVWLTKVYMHAKKDAIEELVTFLEAVFDNRSTATAASGQRHSHKQTIDFTKMGPNPCSLSKSSEVTSATSGIVEVATTMPKQVSTSSKRAKKSKKSVK